MSLFPQLDETAIFLGRRDESENLGSSTPHPIHLDDQDWPSVEHYFQAMKTEDLEMQARIRDAPNPTKAAKLGRSRRVKLRADWKQVRRVMMTRGVYIKCKTYPDIADQLLQTGDRQIIENSQYDYFWGCGRDRRGENTYGKVLMDVRNKLREELKNQD